MPSEHASVALRFTVHRATGSAAALRPWRATVRPGASVAALVRARVARDIARVVIRLDTLSVGAGEVSYRVTVGAGCESDGAFHLTAQEIHL